MKVIDNQKGELNQNERNNLKISFLIFPAGLKYDGVTCTINFLLNKFSIAFS